ncbi:MAG: helix-turn-helix domain-containing protein [Gaiellaceae bacterium]
MSEHLREGSAETIGQRLRRLRLERGLSQRDLAEKGVSYAYISRIEGGARRPSVKALRMLARKLGVSADYLETGSEIRETDQRELRIADAELELRLAGSSPEAEGRLAELRDEALAAGDTVAASRASIALGLAAAGTGRNADAIELLKEGLDLAPVSPGARPDVFATLGHAYSSSGRPDKAVAVFEQCLDDLRDLDTDDLASEVRFTTYLSYALTDLGDLARAEEVLDEALERSESFVDNYSRVRLYWSLARLNDVRGRPATALDCIRRAMALLEVTDDTLHLAKAHMLCATILMSQGRAEGAGRHLESAERLFGHQPGAEDAAQLRRDQARHAVLLGRGQEAIDYARASLEAAADEYPHERGNALWALAEGLALTGQTDQADQTYREATTVLEEHGQHRQLVEAYRSWGKFLRKAGREQDALEVLERAADLASEPLTVEAHKSP